MYSGIVATKKRGRGRPPTLSPCPFCFDELPERKWRVHVITCPKRKNGVSAKVSGFTQHEVEALLKAISKALDEIEYAVDRLRGDECAEGRREEQQWARRFRALQRKLKGAR